MVYFAPQHDPAVAKYIREQPLRLNSLCDHCCDDVWNRVCMVMFSVFHFKSFAGAVVGRGRKKKLFCYEPVAFRVEKLQSSAKKL